MSGYIHTIGFKVLVDSEVIDFTFRVPRGTLLVQILDELETTLRIHPRIISVINPTGEIVTIENHYSTIDFLVQKHGTEYFAGEISIVTFNHGEYIVDLEVPEAMPFAATYRTACKSFNLKISDVSIERQDGQIIDYEVFSRPTAFVLNSWGNFYRIVDKEFGDTLIEPTKEEPEKITPELPIKPYEQMVYPPKIDETEFEIDQITENFMTASERKQEVEEQEEIDETIADESFLTKPIQDKEEMLFRYPWLKDPSTDVGDEINSLDEVPEEESIETLMDNLTLEDEVLKAETEELIESLDEDITEQKEIEEYQEIDKPTVEKSVLEEVFRGIFEEEKKEKDIRESPIDDEEEPILEEDEELATEEILSFYDEDEMEEQAIGEELEVDEEPSDTYDYPEVFEEEEIIDEQSIDDLPSVEDDIVDITSEIEEEISEIGLEEITEDDSKTTIIPPLEQETTEEVSEPPFLQLDERLSLDERLEKRKKELETLETTIKAQQIEKRVTQHSISIEYYSRMYPQKIFPLIIRIPPLDTNNEEPTEIKIQPIFPGCHVIPSEEVIDLYDNKLTIAEFNITPLVRRGKIAGKINLWHKKRNLLTINTTSKVINTFWSYFTGFIAFLLGLLPIILEYLAGTNTLLAAELNFTAKGLFWIELAILGTFVILTLGLAFGLRPSKNTTNRKFYPIIYNQE